jgi:hypothetical protein
MTAPCNDRAVAAGLNRGIGQFFFEVGYGACFAEALIQNDCKPPFELTDAHIEAAWPRSIDAHEDGAEMDQFLALAKAAPDLRATLEWLCQQMEAEQAIGVSGFEDWLKPARQALSKARAGGDL